MSEIKNIPRLRFPGFDDHWRTERLGKISKFQNGVGHEQSIDSEGNIIVVNSKFISTEGEVKKYTQEVLSEIPDDSFSMVMSDVPNGKAIAKCYYFIEGRNYSLNQRICSIKSKTENNKFLFYQINRNKYYLKFDNGVGQTNLRKSEVLNCPVILPSTPEQQKIANFLTSVDKRIELLEKKKTLLETYKKGVMKKIFNQEIRFKDDNGNDFPDWEEKKLGRVCNIQKGKQLNKSELSDNGQYPAINGGVDPSGYTDEWNTVAHTITISEGGNSCGYVNYIKKDFWCGGHCYSLLDIQNYLSKYYLFEYLKFKEKSIMRLRVGSGLPNIQKRDIDGFPILIPSLEEQKKLSNFLSTIGNQIELLETQIDKTKTWKKGLLQKMFV